MGVAGILHTGLTVSDLDRSIAFYRDLLGLELITQWDSRQPYLRTVVGYPDAELRIALLRLPERLGGGAGHHIGAPGVPTAPRVSGATRTRSIPAMGTSPSWWRISRRPMRS